LTNGMPIVSGDATSKMLVSIVVVSFNNEAFIAECLSCAFAQDYEPKEVIVVDQASRDATVAIIRRDFPHARLIENQHNTGFAAGMNRGIASARGELMLLLNSDLFLEATFLSRSVAWLRGPSVDDRVGMLASVVHCHRNGERTSDVNSLGQMLVPYHAVVDSDQQDRVEWVAGPAGSVMLLTRPMLEDIRLPSGDYLDEQYFCYGEDTELALRAQVMGWRCIFVPILAGWHIGGSSAQAGPSYLDKPPALRMHHIKNRY
jgi:GT2 family glycosyltransferase